MYEDDGTSSSWKTKDLVDDKSPMMGPLHQKLYLKFQQDVVQHFLPAQFPTSVTPGYARFALFSFVASVAGSAGMVLSTQTLLLAVGVVGSSQSASVMAGAMNWVLKDGIGQLGGVLFASSMGKTRRFDASPKKWRMVAALSLDCASLMEILSPLVAGPAVLPVACTANILKNVGFLTASASRAAIHQSLAIAGNLADVTAKAGSQSIAAGLLGTIIGVGLSTALGHDPNSFIAGFVGLSLVHQGCNYASLHSVTLTHFNRHRLFLVLDHYLKHRKVLSPKSVAEREVYFPFLNEDDGHTWLSIGSSLLQVCPGGLNELETLQEACPGKTYLVNISHDDKIHLVFLEGATGEDLIRGMLHAFSLHDHRKHAPSAESRITEIAMTYQGVKELFPQLLEELSKQGWKTDTDATNVEPSNALRLSVGGLEVDGGK